MFIQSRLHDCACAVHVWIKWTNRGRIFFSHTSCIILTWNIAGKMTSKPSWGFLVVKLALLRCREARDIYICVWVCITCVCIYSLLIVPRLGSMYIYIDKSRNIIFVNIYIYREDWLLVTVAGRIVRKRETEISFQIKRNIVVLAIFRLI